MRTWNEFATAAPDLAEAGRKEIYQWEPVGLAFLATVRPDGGPRVHPVCPAVTPDGLLVPVQPGPKQQDLLRDGRYALHSETCPPPREDDGFFVTGVAHRVEDPEVKVRLGERLKSERKLDALWPSWEDDIVFELLIERALLMRTQADDQFAQGATIWKAPAA